MTDDLLVFGKTEEEHQRALLCGSPKDSKRERTEHKPRQVPSLPKRGHLLRHALLRRRHRAHSEVHERRQHGRRTTLEDHRKERRPLGVGWDRADEFRSLKKELISTRHMSFYKEGLGHGANHRCKSGRTRSRALTNQPVEPRGAQHHMLHVEAPYRRRAPIQPVRERGLLS
jgi:hypothetical protein